MANEFDTSFIPQQPLLRVEGGPKHREAVSFPLILALVVFFAVLVVAGGVYYYKVRADRVVLDKTLELEAAERGIDDSQVERYKKLDTRLKIAKDLLASHTAFSIGLNLIEDAAAQNIGLKNLKYYNDTLEGFQVALDGVAPTYAAAYFQAETWKSKTPLIRSVALKDVTLDTETGLVTFSMVLSIDKEQFRYPLLISAEQRTGEEASVNVDEATPKAASSGSNDNITIPAP